MRQYIELLASSMLPVDNRGFLRARFYSVFHSALFFTRVSMSTVGNEFLGVVEVRARLQGIEEQGHRNDHQICLQINDFGLITTQDRQYHRHKFHVCYILGTLDMVHHHTSPAI